MWIWKVIGILALIAILLVLRSYQNLSKRKQKPHERTVRRAGDGAEPAKRALLLYCRSKHDSMDRAADIVAEELARRGYDVTVNHPAEGLPYDVEEFDLLAFGSPAYFGSASAALLDYLKANPFRHKRALIFVVGYSADDQREIKQIRECISQKNSVVSIKVFKPEMEKLRGFVDARVGMDAAGEPAQT